HPYASCLLSLENADSPQASSFSLVAFVRRRSVPVARSWRNRSSPSSTFSYEMYRPSGDTLDGYVRWPGAFQATRYTASEVGGRLLRVRGAAMTILARAWRASFV